MKYTKKIIKVKRVKNKHKKKSNKAFGGIHFIIVIVTALFFGLLVEYFISEVPSNGWTILRLD